MHFVSDAADIGESGKQKQPLPVRICVWVLNLFDKKSVKDQTLTC